MGQNINTKTAGTVNDGTYVGFLVLTILGAALAWMLVDARDVIRADGSKIIVMQHPSWKSEITGLYQTFFSDFYIVLLFPMFLASNWFYTYHFTEINAAYFNVRTRALNGVVYYMMQIVGAYVFGYALDIKGVRRTTRAKVAWAVLFASIMIIWGFGYMFQKTYDRTWAENENNEKKDWADPGYAGPFVLYMFYGFSDAAWQTCVYWCVLYFTHDCTSFTNFG